jgi:hypothetical protein
MALSIEPNIDQLRVDLDLDYTTPGRYKDVDEMCEDEAHTYRYKTVSKVDKYLSDNGPDYIEHDYDAGCLLDHIGIGTSTSMEETIQYWLSKMTIINLDVLCIDSVIDGD